MAAFRTIDEHDPQWMRWLVSGRTSDERPESGSIGRTGQPSSHHSRRDRGAIGHKRASTPYIRRPKLRRRGIGLVALQEGVVCCTSSVRAAAGIIAAAHPILPRPSGQSRPPVNLAATGQTKSCAYKGHCDGCR